LGSTVDGDRGIGGNAVGPAGSRVRAAETAPAGHQDIRAGNQVINTRRIIADHPRASADRGDSG